MGDSSEIAAEVVGVDRMIWRIAIHSRILIFGAMILVLAIVVISCSKSVEYEPGPPDPYEDLKAQIAQSPRPDEEAELMVLFSTGHVVAHQRDYDRIREAVSLVRETFRDSVPFLDSVQFAHNVSVGVVLILLNEGAVGQLRDGSFVDWDSLNTLYRVAEIDTTWLESSNQVVLTFEGRLNPSLLSFYYAQLESVVGTGISPRAGDYSNIYPWMSGFDDRTFLLRKAWGDCLNQCDHNRFWYFKVVDGEAKYIGEYDPNVSPISPVWWDEARVSLCAYVPKSHFLCIGL
jgi:hypothetical protein